MRRVVIATVAIAVVVALIAVGLRVWSSPASDAHQPARASTRDVHRRIGGSGGARVVDGVPTGWSRNATGARAAAVSAVGLTGTIARAGFITRRDMVMALASQAYGPTLADSSADQIDSMLRELGPVGISMDSIVFQELPLTARLQRVDAATARVSVWSVIVLGVSGRGAPRQFWRTVTVDLVWESDDWRIDRWTAVAGPTPILDAHATAATVDQIAAVSAWPSTAGAG